MQLSNSIIRDMRKDARAKGASTIAALCDVATGRGVLSTPPERVDARVKLLKLHKSQELRRRFDAATNASEVIAWANEAFDIWVEGVHSTNRGYGSHTEYAWVRIEGVLYERGVGTGELTHDRWSRVDSVPEHARIERRRTMATRWSFVRFVMGVVGA